MQSLSVVIITFNEERNIGRCIESAESIADEIIVMDSYSSDASLIAIAKEKGCIVHQQVFSGYGPQKNAAATFASFDHIFFLDADEFLSDALIASVRAQKSSGFAFDGYSMNRLNNYCGQWIRHGSWYPDKKLRLINRHKGSWNNDLVHENITMHDQSTIMHLTGDLLHYAYNSIGEHVAKNNTYSELSAELMLAKGRRSNALSIVVNPFWSLYRVIFSALVF